MKKVLTFTLATLMVLTMCFALVSCECEHVWNDGEITTIASQAADGVKTFTCKECGETRTEAVSFTGLTEAEWNAALSIGNFSNFSYVEDASVAGTGFTMDTKMEYKFTENKAYIKMTMAGQSEDETITNKLSADAYREELVNSIIDIVKFADYDYDAATKTYKANKAIEIELIGGSSEDITLKFDDSGKIVEIKYSLSVTESGIEMTATSTVTIEYGNVTL